MNPGAFPPERGQAVSGPRPPAMRIALGSRWIVGVSGATTYILERTRRFSSLGWQVHLYGERLDEKRILDVGGMPRRLRGWPWGSTWKRRFFSWRFARAVARSHYDLVEGHGDVLNQDVLILHNCVHAAHEAIHGKPLSEDSGTAWIHSKILRERRFRRLIANSRLMREDVVRRFGVPEEKVAVIYPGCDLRRFKPGKSALDSDLRRQLGVREGEIMVGLITSGDFRKRGVDIMIRSLALLSPEVRNRLHAVVSGKEKQLAEYRRMAQESGLGSRIHFLEAIPEVDRYFQALDIFFYPARYEEFGLSVQEAMASGIPVLTSRQVGASELLGQGGDSMLLERPDAEAFARKLEDWIGHPEIRAQWGLAGRKAVERNDWDAHFKKTRALYELVFSEKDNSAPFLAGSGAYC